MVNKPNYKIVNIDTGEFLDMEIYFERTSKAGWEKAYAKVLTAYIDVAGDKSAQFLAWIIKARERSNILLGTQREMAEKSGVSMTVVKRIMKALIERDLLRKVRSGAYMLTPKMIRNGDRCIGAAMIKQWDDCLPVKKAVAESMAESEAV